MKTIAQICNELTLLNANIQENYPELYRHLQENLPAVPEPTKHSRQSGQTFEDYLNRLKYVLKEYSEQHNTNSWQLPDLAAQINYKRERFQSARIAELNQQQALLFAFTQGQELKTHSVAHDVVLIMLEGKCAFTLAKNEPQLLTAAQIIRIPGNVKHSLKAISDFKMVLLK